MEWTGDGKRLGSIATLNGLPSDVLAFPNRRQNVRGMWLKCGAKPRAPDP
jgi:hypothetical protein